MKTFKDLAVNESVTTDSSEFGFRVYGEVLTVQLNQHTASNLMDLTFSGTRTLPRVKSVENIKAEYREEDWINIEKLYSKMNKKYGKEAEKLVKDFEAKLNKIVVEMEKETSKF